ncbi:unnamed protein product [Clonostachys rosea f. rosea IK726]|uniref:Uncharacterized protein n=1 Tax=Clonostachys rosea f. rosea IK726 TaxID=1349383 RepID=A0ACA9UIV1_BIOOC|nr:unnamed protein product [Clonostachys rosea f. rosea IK726]
MASQHTAEVPSGSWDNHIHVFEPSKHPYSPNRSYTPGAAPLADYPKNATGCSNIVVVQATVQGTGPAPLLDTLSLKSPHGGVLRGLAALDLEKVSDDELDRLHAAGVRGVRMHEVSWGFGDQPSDNVVAEKITYAAQRLNRLGWVIDLYMHPKAWAALAPTIEALPPSTKVVADHWAGFRSGGEDSPEFQVFLGLLRRQRVYIKLSAFERQYHGNDMGISSLDNMARAIIEAGPNRILFGSDWPNTALASDREGRTREERLTIVEDFRKVPHAEHVARLREWIRDEVVWRKFWIDNPAALFE